MLILLFYLLHLYHFDATQVMQRNFLRSGKILGTFKLDVATVMSQQGIISIIVVQQNEKYKILYSILVVCTYNRTIFLHQMHFMLLLFKCKARRFATHVSLCTTFTTRK